MRINEGLVFLLFTVVTCISCTHQERIEDSGIVGAQGETLENVMASADAQQNGVEQVVASNEKDSGTKEEENVGVTASASDERNPESESIREEKTGEKVSEPLPVASNDAEAGLKESSVASDGWDLTAPPLMAGTVEQGEAASTFSQTDRKRLGRVASAKVAAPTDRGDSKKMNAPITRNTLVKPLTGSDVGTPMPATPGASQPQSTDLMREDGESTIAAAEKNMEKTALASAEIGGFLERHRFFLVVITGILLLMTWYMVRPKKKTGTEL